MKVALALMTAVLLNLAPASPAVAVTTSPDRVVCASLSLEFFPRTIEPEQTLDYIFDLSNCGSIRERLTVRLVPSGPCRFIPPSEKTYDLQPGQGFEIASLMIGPSCPGEFHLRGVVLFRGHAVDRALASLRVLESYSVLRRSP